MIQEILIKNSPVFQEVNIQLHSGLNVFSGASGVGKSVLMESILALFGHKESNASLIEARFNEILNFEKWGIQSDEETTFSILKKDKTRYFINGQKISKNRVLEITSSFVKYLGSRYLEIDEEYLCQLLDLFIIKNQPNFSNVLEQHKKIFNDYCICEKEYKQLLKNEQHIEELKEFASYEIQKISSIAPKIGEYEQLIEQKKLLSKCDKINELFIRVDEFYEKSVYAIQLLSLLDKDVAFFEEALHELRTIIDEEKEKLEELLELDAGILLERISLLADLHKRYGGEKEALEYLHKKQEELKHYENIVHNKEEIYKKLQGIKEKLSQSSNSIHKERIKYLKEFETNFNAYLNSLHVQNAVFQLMEQEEQNNGRDKITFSLQATALKNISAGELSRTRLALLAMEVSLHCKVGILILDEVDANLSGEESEGVAKILKKLSASYQVFVISHQPHIPILSDRHFLVYKEHKKSSQSKVMLLKQHEQIQEVARMISGAEITHEALQYAQKRLNDKT